MSVVKTVGIIIQQSLNYATINVKSQNRISKNIIIIYYIISTI